MPETLTHNVGSAFVRLDQSLDTVNEANSRLGDPETLDQEAAEAAVARIVYFGMGQLYAFAWNEHIRDVGRFGALAIQYRRLLMSVADDTSEFQADSVAGRPGGVNPHEPALLLLPPNRVSGPIYNGALVATRRIITDAVESPVEVIAKAARAGSWMRDIATGRLNVGDMVTRSLVFQAEVLRRGREEDSLVEYTPDSERTLRFFPRGIGSMPTQLSYTTREAPQGPIRLDFSTRMQRRSGRVS